MPTLLMRLAGPMQSWGTRSRFDERDTEKEPSKSGVIGLLAAALGIDRHEEAPILELAKLKMGVRVDREGILQYDYHTFQKYASMPEKKQITAVSHRYFLADAVFLVGLEGADLAYLQKLQAALQNPVWFLALGRRSFMPSRPVWLPNGVEAAKDLETSLQEYPPLVPDLKKARLLLEAEYGSLRMDQPISSFATRGFSARFVASKMWKKEATDVSEQARA